MPTLAEFTPLREESVDSIRARIDAGINAGLDPADPRWTDTTPGGFFYDHTQVMALEAELLWDFASVELPASFFLPFSWGVYLDYWGELLGVERKDEASATGVVTFENTTDEPIVLGTGVEVAAPTVDPDEEPLVFVTTESGEVPAGGTLDVAVEADEPGSQHNVAAGAITLVLSAVEGVTVTNAAGMSGGADVESDESYKQRLLLEFSGTRGGGTRDDYTAAALARPGIGGVVVEPRWDGPGTVRLVLTDESGNALSSPALAAEQEYWDPSSAPGMGFGAAPINHEVTVATVTVLTPPIKLWLILEDGYTVDADPGLEDISASVSAAVAAYIAGLKPGDDVLRNRLVQAALEVPGVYNVAQVHVNNLNSDYSVGALQVVRLGLVTLTSDAP